MWDSQINRIWTQNYIRDHLWNVGCSDSINPCVYAIHKVVGRGTCQKSRIWTQNYSGTWDPQWDAGAVNQWDKFRDKT